VSGTYSLRLGKEDFKFSAAHFTAFGEDEAEALHGHNYRVSVELSGPEVDELEFLVPVAAAKRDIRSQCAELDEKVLLPEECPHLELTRSGETVTTRFGTRRYEFPSSEVVLLPVANVTVEALARLLWERLADRWGSLRDATAPGTHPATRNTEPRKPKSPVRRPSSDTQPPRDRSLPTWEAT